MIDVYIDHLASKYPAIDREKFKALLHANLLSPYIVELPQQVLIEAQQFIQKIFRLRQSFEYKDFLSQEMSQRQITDPGNFGICMSYDFHLNENQQLKLIEINTNASFLALGTEFYEAFAFPKPVNFKIESLVDCIHQELLLNGKSKETPRIAIVDDQPEQQRLFSEFLLYQAIFQKAGIETSIQDFRQISNVNFVYNRWTDFYFQAAAAEPLLRKFNSREICFSPNPFEYLALADKQRMIDWLDPLFWQQMSDEQIANRIFLSRFLPETQTITADNVESIWAHRKKYFFKPKRAHGSKQSYKGERISRRIVDEMTNGDYIAQEYIPAPERKFEPNPRSQQLLGNSEPQIFKYDLRFYTYQDQLQMVLARLYQGQVTNAKTLGGGFALVNFSNG